MRPTSHQAPSTTITSLNHQGTIDPKSTDVVPSEDSMQSRSEKQKSGRFSRAGSKQSSVRRTPKLDNASFSNSALVQSVARIGTPGPEEASSVYGHPLSNRSFESSTNYADQTASRLTNGSVRLQDMGDPEYAVSRFGDTVRSTSLMGSRLNRLLILSLRRAVELPVPARSSLLSAGHQSLRRHRLVTRLSFRAWLA